MLMRKIILSLAMLLLATAIMSAQNTTHARLDSLFDALSAGGKTMGSICISQKGKNIYSRAIGYCVIDGGTKTAATEKTKYRVASITKMFTASIIFQLMQEGRIDYSTPLDKFFPEIPGAKNITIGLMLNHRSGIHNIYDDGDFVSWKTKPKSQDEIVAMIAKNPLDFSPDTKSYYSNSNYILLGYIIEEICDKPYSEVVKDRITAKVGLKNTYYGDKTNLEKGESYSYVYNGDWIKQPEADVSILGGAGALVSTPADLNKFVHALFDNKVIKQRYLTKMQNITEGFGMGMFSFSYGDRTLYGHPGGIDGFSILMEYYPDEDIAVSFCSNGLVGSTNDVVNAVLSILFGKPLEN